MEEQRSLTRFLTLGTLEAVLNQAIALDQQLAARLPALHGTVVRIRLDRPATSIYLLIVEDGVEVLEGYEGQVDIRVRTSLGALLQWLLAPGAEAAEDDRIRVTGNEPQLGQLLALVAEFDLWSALRRWFDDHVRLEDLLALLRREDPRWLSRLEQVGVQVDQIANELGRQRLLQEEILDELIGLKRGMRRERRLDLLFLSSGMTLLFAAFATTTGQLPLLWQQPDAGAQTLALASLGLTLILSRVLFGHRYS